MEPDSFFFMQKYLILCKNIIRRKIVYGNCIIIVLSTKKRVNLSRRDSVFLCSEMRRMLVAMSERKSYI